MDSFTSFVLFCFEWRMNCVHEALNVTVYRKLGLDSFTSLLLFRFKWRMNCVHKDLNVTDTQYVNGKLCFHENICCTIYVTVLCSVHILLETPRENFNFSSSPPPPPPSLFNWSSQLFKRKEKQKRDENNVLRVWVAIRSNSSNFV